MRADVYLRQSLDSSGEGLAVARQETECRALCDRLGLEVGAVWTDNDVSATSGAPRPAFDAMLAARPAAIVAWHQDRLLRLTRDLERVIDLDVPIYTATAGTLDLSTPAGRAVARTVAAWSQYETEQKGLRQRAAHVQRANAGKPWTTRRPFGFEPDGITHRPDEVEIVVAMYADLIAGTSQAEIARDLNARGIPTTLGNPWRQGTVRALLMNPRNAGLRAHNGEIVGSGAWEPIVPESTWRAAVAKMTANEPRKGGGARVHWLTALARCGVCGGLCRTMKSRRGQRIYACRDQHVARDAESVDALVRALVVERLSRPDARDLLIDRDADDTAALQAEADDARRALDSLAEMFAAGEMPVSAFRAGTERGTARLAAIESRMARTARADLLDVVVNADDVGTTFDGLSLGRRRGILDALMTVTIDRTVQGGRFRPEHVRIEWKA